VFVGWLYSYAIYACILAPIKLIIFWRCCVSDWEQQRKLDDHIAHQHRTQQLHQHQIDQQRWAGQRATSATTPTTIVTAAALPPPSTSVHPHVVVAAGGGHHHVALSHVHIAPMPHAPLASPTQTPNNYSVMHVNSL
jgi:hypothetical protein